MWGPNINPDGCLPPPPPQPAPGPVQAEVLRHGGGVPRESETMDRQLLSKVWVRLLSIEAGILYELWTPFPYSHSHSRLDDVTYGSFVAQVGYKNQASL